MAKKKQVKGVKKNPATPKKIVMTNRKEFLDLKEFLCKRKDNFDYTSAGSINTIIFDNKEFISVDVEEAGGRGHHLNKRYKKDINNWIVENGEAMQQYPPDYKEQLFNLSAIEKCIGRPVVAIDINDCYWKTSLKLGYITEETYIIGLKKKEWKTGRNACIGSLRKTKTIVPYVAGKPQYKLKRPIKSPKEYGWIRNHIIGFIYQMFFRLYEELGDNFYMFLTDCIFTDYKSKRYVEKFFADYGYKVKSKPVEFLSVDRKEKKISWYDFEAPRRNHQGITVGKGVEKYYLYANRQLIGGVASPENKINLLENK